MADPTPEPRPQWPTYRPAGPSASRSRRPAIPAAPERRVPVPFFSRLGVRHGIILTALVVLAMTVITVMQIHETLAEIQKSAVDKGRTVAASLVPFIREHEHEPAVLKKFFNEIEKLKDIDYVQIVDAQGNVVVGSDVPPMQRPPVPLEPDWIARLAEHISGNRFVLAEPWPADGRGKGVDVFVALLENPGALTPEKLRAAPHLRIGINFDDVVQTDTPRVFRNMVIFTVVVAAVMVLGLIIFLGYVLRPLRQLHLGLRALARGDLDYEVPVYTRDEVGQVVQAFNATTARLKSAFEQIEALATRDHLTGLPNRRVFDERLSAEAARSRRYGHPFGLIVMDLDKFKAINDTYGHPVGDEVLKYVAKMIEVSIRETDVPARIGGEEFAIILPETSFEDVNAVAEKLRFAVAERGVRAENIDDLIRVTLSGGAACSSGHLVTPEAMLNAADAALYQSKSEGRNRITIAARVAGKSHSLMKKVEGIPTLPSNPVLLDKPEPPESPDSLGTPPPGHA